MKTTKEYNKDYMDRFTAEKSSKYSTGIACDKCGKELTYTMPDIILTSYPPQKAVHCDG